MKQPKLANLIVQWRSLSAEQLVFMKKLGSSKISDSAFILALVLTRELGFSNYKTFLIYSIAQEIGVSCGELLGAFEELTGFGVLDMQKIVVRPPYIRRRASAMAYSELFNVRWASQRKEMWAPIFED